MERGTQSDLVEHIEAIATLLRRYQVHQWADRMTRHADSIRRGDESAVDHFLSEFGGMGSLNDVIVCRDNGHKIFRLNEARVNAKLSRLRSASFKLARELRPANPDGA